MPLRVIKRKSTGALTISGTVAGQRIQRRAQSDKLALAREEAAAIEAEILRTEWHGERRGARSFDEALVSYLEAQPRSDSEKRRLSRIRDAMGGDTPLSRAAQQETANRVREKILRPDAKPGTVQREVVTPIRSVVRHAAAQGWCDPPRLISQPATLGRTLYMLPDEAERLLASAATHLQPLLVFLIGTGARMTEALELEWRDVDLAGRRAIFWRTKNERRRNVFLPPRVVVALANLGHRDGRVFVHHGGGYTGRDRGYGGQIKTAWGSALRRSGLDLELTPHDCRHTWATWHYAIHKDLLQLKQDGLWSSVALVERYAHLMPAGHELGIKRFLGEPYGAAEARA
jgi:integrase